MGEYHSDRQADVHYVCIYLYIYVMYYIIYYYYFCYYYYHYDRYSLNSLTIVELDNGLDLIGMCDPLISVTG